MRWYPFYLQLLKDRLPQALPLIKKLKKKNWLGFTDRWDPPSVNDEKKITLLKQLFQFDQDYSPGLIHYLETARKLLSDQNPQKKIEIEQRKLFSPPPTYQPKSHLVLKYEEQGIALIDQIALVLVAGGLGQRLGSDQIKIKLISNAFHPRSFMSHYAAFILQLQKLFNEEKSFKTEIPLYIMTSRETHLATLEFFKQENYFNLNPEQVHFFQQISGPGLIDKQANLAIEKKYDLTLLPLGHGFIHDVFLKQKTIEKLLAKKKKYLFFFQDTHLQIKNVLLSSLGVTHLQQKHFSFITTSMSPQESLGIIVKQTHRHRARVRNIEYSEQKPWLSTHHQFNANTNAFWVDLATYRKTIQKFKKVIPLVNLKNQDDKTEFQSPIRLEWLMQNISLFYPIKKITTINYPREMVFAPLKNKVSDILTNPRSSPMTALRLEESEFKTNRNRLETHNQILTTEKKNQILECLPISGNPKIILGEYFITQKRIESSFNLCCFHPGSLLVCDMKVKMNNLTLTSNTALIITQSPSVDQAQLTIDDLIFDRLGYRIKCLKARDLNSNRYDFNEKLRGYLINWKRPYQYHITANGSYRIDKNFNLIQTEESF